MEIKDARGLVMGHLLLILCVRVLCLDWLCMEVWLEVLDRLGYLHHPSIIMIMVVIVIIISMVREI